MKKAWLKILPYLICIIVGGILLIISFKTPLEEPKSLYLNLAATFFGIPLVFLIFDCTKAFSSRKLNKETFDYVKMLVDIEVLSATKHLMKILYSYKDNKNTLNDILKFLNLEKSELENLLKTENKIGFQIFKKFEVNEQNIQNLLNNSLLIKSLSDEQMISLIGLLKSITQFRILNEKDDLFLNTGKKLSNLKISQGTEINPLNNKYPDRYLLLDKIDGKEFVVIDFGDFTEEIKEDFNSLFLVNESYVVPLSKVFANFITETSNWLSLTGNEFIVDQKQIRIRKKP